MHSWDLPTGDKSMKAVKRCRLAKNAADFFHHVFVDIKTTGINIAEHNHSSISDYLRIKSLDFTELHIILQRRLNLAGLVKCHGLNFIKADEIKTSQQSTSFFLIIIDKGGSRYGTARNQPSTLADFLINIAFSCALWGKFHQV